MFRNDEAGLVFESTEVGWDIRLSAVRETLANIGDLGSGVSVSMPVDMTRRTITGVVIVPTTIAAAMVIWFWALRPLGFASYLTSPGASDADIIRQYWPNRLVQPEWVNTTPDRLIHWHLTETAARLAVVAVLWLFVAAGVAFGFVRGQCRKNGSRQFNHTATGRISNL